MCSAQAHVRFTPESDIKCDIWECPLGQKQTHAVQQKGSLFDYFVGAGEHARWEREAKRFGSYRQKRTRAAQLRMSALGQKQTYASQQALCALHPIATARADFGKSSCLLFLRKRTCAVKNRHPITQEFRLYAERLRIWQNPWV